MTLAASDIKAIVEAGHEDVFAVLGPHVVDTRAGAAVAVRAFLPDADTARVVPVDAGREPRPMERLHPAGLFEAVFPDYAKFKD